MRYLQWGNWLFQIGTVSRQARVVFCHETFPLQRTVQFF